MKDTSDRLIFVLIAVLVLFGVLSFFANPAYEKGVWAIIGAAVAALTGLFGFKFGVHVPTQKESFGVQIPNQPAEIPQKEVSL